MPDRCRNRPSASGGDGERFGSHSQNVGQPGPRHKISFANVDCQLLLWVDGSLVEFDKETTYEPLETDVPTIEDLTPARIGSRGAALSG